MNSHAEDLKRDLRMNSKGENVCSVPEIMMDPLKMEGTWEWVERGKIKVQNLQGNCNEKQWEISLKWALEQAKIQLQVWSSY